MTDGMATRKKRGKPRDEASSAGDGPAEETAGAAAQEPQPAPPVVEASGRDAAEGASEAWLAVPVDESAIQTYQDVLVPGAVRPEGEGQNGVIASSPRAGGVTGGNAGEGMAFPPAEVYGRSDDRKGKSFGDGLDLLCFDVATESFGIDIRRVKEIIRAREVTELPGVAEYVNGIISLRGAIVPVLDLRRRLGFEKAEDVGPDARIIVLAVGEKSAGVFVDAVSQKIRMPKDSMVPPPAVLGNAEAAFLLGVCRHQGRLISVLNPEEVLDIDGGSAGEGGPGLGEGKAA